MSKIENVLSPLANELMSILKEEALLKQVLLSSSQPDKKIIFSNPVAKQSNMFKEIMYASCHNI